MIIKTRQELIDLLQSELKEGLDPVTYAHGLEQEVNADFDAEVSSMHTIVSRALPVRLAYLA